MITTPLLQRATMRTEPFIYLQTAISGTTFKNYYGGQILRKSVKVQNPAGKDAIFNIETLVNSGGTVIRREVRHVNSGRNRYWLNKEVN